MVLVEALHKVCDARVYLYLIVHGRVVRVRGSWRGVMGFEGSEGYLQINMKLNDTSASFLQGAYFFVQY